MMNMSITMEYVLLRATSEAAAFSGGKVSTEHLFLGLLKLPEVRGKDVLKDESRSGEFDAEAAEVGAIVRAKGWNAPDLRGKLRLCLKQEKLPDDAEEQMQYVLGSAAYHAQKDRSSETVNAADVLGAILRHPTLMLTVVLGGSRPAPAPEAAPEAAEPAPAEPEGIAFLPKLTADVRALRYELLKCIFGQDQAVHALTEGIFSAELLAAADSGRKGPRGVFVFAGPPGVGKTFMAERTAAALRLPFKRLDMSSYADHQAHVNLIGFAPSFKDAKPGQLTGFVKKHPRCILLLDELEKAHGNVIRLLLQVLDGGRLHDDYTDEDVDFRDSLIILTTNAGRQLWESEVDPAGLPRQSVLSALRTDIDPATHQPYFPEAICSRLSAGYVILFNRLSAHDLGCICEAELERFSSLFGAQYGIRVSFDRLLPTALLFSEGAGADARALCSRVQRFCRNEIYRLCSLWSEDHVEKALAGLHGIRFDIDAQALTGEVRELFVNPRRPEILVVGGQALCEALQANLPDFDILPAATAEEAYTLAGKHEPLLLLMDMQTRAAEGGLPSDPFDGSGWEAETVRLVLDETEPAPAGFDNLPLTAGSIRAQTAFLMDAQERGLGLPVWLLETPVCRMDDELMSALSRVGVRGKLLRPDGDYGVFAEQLQQLAGQAYLQQTAAALGAEQRVLTFGTEPSLSEDSHTALIRLTELRIGRAAEAEDVGDLLEGAERSNLCFDDVIGAAEAKEELRFFASYLSNPKRFLAQGLHPPKGILLYGPPGTGKTLLARAMAGEAKVAFIAEEATNFVTKYQGSGPEAIRRLFRKARRYAPAVVFIDEIDAIGRSRGSLQTGHGEEMALNALLTEMDGFRTDPKRPVFVLAATNFAVESGEPGAPGTIDPALSRRFDRKILVGLPDRQDRLTYVRRQLGAATAVTEAAAERLASRSAGMSLAELSGVLEQGSRSAARQQRAMNDADLEEAFERIRHGSEKHWGDGYMERVACHEAGHALLCHLSGRTPAYLTIVARGSHGGYMEHADTEDTPLRTRQELLGRIRTALGGRAAELVRFGPEEGLSTGASGDLAQATELASALLLRYGMDAEFGGAAFDRRELLSGPLAARYAEKLNAILARELEAAADLLRANRPALDRLAEALLQHNKLTGEEIAALIDAK